MHTDEISQLMLLAKKQEKIGKRPRPKSSHVWYRCGGKNAVLLGDFFQRLKYIWLLKNHSSGNQVPAYLFQSSFNL